MLAWELREIEIVAKFAVTVPVPLINNVVEEEDAFATKSGAVTVQDDRKYGEIAIALML